VALLEKFTTQFSLTY